jgi:uncharacterized membrane protein
VPFPVRLLGEGEEVVAEIRPHWSYLGWPLVATVVAAGTAIAVAVEFPNTPVGVAYFLFAVVGVAFAWFAARYVRRAATSVVITNARVVRRSGVLSRSNLEIRLERINELSSKQSIGGRLLRCGEVLVEVGGMTGVVVLDHIPRPALVQSVISEQVSRWQRAARMPQIDPRVPFDPRLPVLDTPPTGTLRTQRSEGAQSAAERLVQLDELRRRGLLSESEYESKRQQLLEEL